ncbi:MAG: hypothetical protein M1281_03140 [Chloroflexi bacterium]|nr:hypothetical protein [Chloroflexota bacterium]
MSDPIPNLLNHTLNLIQLARETALVQGKKTQAERLTPVAEDLRTLVATSREAKPPAASGGILGQSDFRTLLEAAKAPQVSAQSGSTAALERNRAILAMAAGDMTEVEIARQMGMTRDEVRLVLSIGRNSEKGMEKLR